MSTTLNHIPKIVGIEQEYAIKTTGSPSLGPFDASCLLVNTYARHAGVGQDATRPLWDYGHETPYTDIRGPLFSKKASRSILSDRENRLINAALPNGARLYTDHAHPEYATPECRSAIEVVACDKAGEQILCRSMAWARRSAPEIGITLFKNNSDHMGHSYGCHENYLMDAKAHDNCLVGHPEKALALLIPFLVTRQIYAGAGKVGNERKNAPAADFQLAQRAEFIETLFGLETMYSRSLINTRAEHHADALRFRRLHLILGDANMCEFAGFLKIGATQIILQMLEQQWEIKDLTLADPVRAMQQIAVDANTAIALQDGRRLSALQIQHILHEQAVSFEGEKDTEPIPESNRILDCWQTALEGLEKLRISDEWEILDDPLQLSRRLDWVLKLWMIDRFRREKKCLWDDSRLRVLDLQYHNIDPQQGIFYRLQQQGLTERLLSDDQIHGFVENAPGGTRAFFRSQCLKKFSREIFMINWEVVGFDHGDVHRMVPLLNPSKGTREQFGELFANVSDSREFISRLEDGASE